MEQNVATFLKRLPPKPKIDASKIIKSPMPGLVKSISCQVGDQVCILYYVDIIFY